MAEERRRADVAGGQARGRGWPPSRHARWEAQGLAGGRAQAGGELGRNGGLPALLQWAPTMPPLWYSGWYTYTCWYFLQAVQGGSTGAVYTWALETHESSMSRRDALTTSLAHNLPGSLTHSRTHSPHDVVHCEVECRYGGDEGTDDAEHLQRGIVGIMHFNNFFN